MMHQHVKETVQELHRHLHILLNFNTYHYSTGMRPPEERAQLDAAVECYKEMIMEAFLKAVEEVKVAVEAKDKHIADLTAAAVGMIPEHAAIDAVKTIVPPVVADPVHPPAHPVA